MRAPGDRPDKWVPGACPIESRPHGGGVLRHSPMSSARTNRIVVVGASGSGKSTLARSLETRCGHARLELDALHHGPGWTRRPAETVRWEVRAFLEREGRWVIDGNWFGLRDLVWPRADTMVWLDPSRARLLAQVVTRTVRRTLTREELWNGNREPWSNLYSLDPERSIIAWSMTSLAGYRAELAERMSRGEPGNARWVRLTSRREVEGFVARLERDRGAEG